MNNLFYTDVNNILMEYAGLKDMMNIKKVIPDMKLAKNSIDKKIIQTINIRLGKVFGDKLESFKAFLEDTQSIISGSFIMQCVLEEEYENSDIDVYMHYKNTDKLRNFIGGRIVFFESNNDNYKPDNIDIFSPIKYVTEYVYNDTKVQFILMLENNSEKYVEHFDIDLCKNMYQIKNNKEYINIHNIDMLFEKKGTINCHMNLNKHVDRYIKYTNRGYTLNKIIPDKMIKSIMKKEDVYKVTIISEINNCLKIKYSDNKICNTTQHIRKIINIQRNQLIIDTKIIKCNCNKHDFPCLNQNCSYDASSRDDSHKKTNNIINIFACWSDNCVFKFCDIRHIHCDDNKFILLS